jgi:Contractile injection system tube protein
MELQKAMIAELDGDTEKDSFPVQFNPTTLRLSLSNRVEGGESQGKQVRQHIGASSTTLTLDLIFDTADEGTTQSPRSVREKTRQLEKFLVAKGEGQQENAPPRMRFSWGDLIVEGVIESMTIDFEHFAANGVPLRAKVPLSIKGQDREKELKGADDSRKGAPGPGGASAGLGGGIGLGGSLGIGLGASIGIGFSASVGIGLSASVGIGIGIGASASVGVALGGESAGEFAARVGVDPAAWRGLQIGGESSLSLSAGVEVGFSANLSASAGLGVTVGLEAGTKVSIEQSFGLATSTSLSAVSGVGVGAQLASGFALSSAGGVRAAIESVQTVKNVSAEQKARAAFKAPVKELPANVPSSLATARSVSTTPKSPEQARPPLSRTGLPGPSAQQAAPPAPRPPRADPRASSFGFGVPLRSTVGAAADRRFESIQGAVSLKAKITSGDPPTTNDPTKPAWEALPARDPGRKAADKLQGKLQIARPCGCAGRCKH